MRREVRGLFVAVVLLVSIILNLRVNPEIDSRQVYLNANIANLYLNCLINITNNYNRLYLMYYRF